MDPSINRKISQPVTAWLVRCPITPNQVSLLSLVAGLACAAFLLQGREGWLLGALWFQISYVLDNCDGELARLTGRSSGFGSWLDTACDCIIHMAFFMSLGIGLSRSQGDLLWLRLGLAATAGTFLCYLASILRQVQLRGREAWLHPDAPHGQRMSFSRWIRVVLREDFSLVVLTSALVGHMGWLLWGGVVGACIYWMSDAISILLLGTRRSEG